MRTLASISSILLLSVVAAACGNKEGSEVNGGSGSNNNGTGATGGGFVLGNGATGAVNLGSGTVIPPDAACATGTASAALSGVNMFVMFDRSSSMRCSTATSRCPSRSRAWPSTRKRST